MLHHYGVVPEASSTFQMVLRHVANKAKWSRPLQLIFLFGPGDDGQEAFWVGTVLELLNLTENRGAKSE